MATNRRSPQEDQYPRRSSGATITVPEEVVISKLYGTDHAYDGPVQSTHHDTTRHNVIVLSNYAASATNAAIWRKYDGNAKYTTTDVHAHTTTAAQQWGLPEGKFM